MWGCPATIGTTVCLPCSWTWTVKSHLYFEKYLLFLFRNLWGKCQYSIITTFECTIIKRKSKHEPFTLDTHDIHLCLQSSDYRGLSSSHHTSLKLSGAKLDSEGFERGWEPGERLRVMSTCKSSKGPKFSS